MVTIVAKWLITVTSMNRVPGFEASLWQLLVNLNFSFFLKKAKIKKSPRMANAELGTSKSTISL